MSAAPRAVLLRTLSTAGDIRTQLRRRVGLQRRVGSSRRPPRRWLGCTRALSSSMITRPRRCSYRVPPTAVRPSKRSRAAPWPALPATRFDKSNRRPDAVEFTKGGYRNAIGTELAPRPRKHGDFQRLGCLKSIACSDSGPRVTRTGACSRNFPHKIKSASRVADRDHGELPGAAPACVLPRRGADARARSHPHPGGSALVSCDT